MFKERTLPYDYGQDISPGHMYYNSSRSYGTNTALALLEEMDTLGGMTDARSYGQDLANKSIPDQSTSVSGVEEFYSTERRRPYFNNVTHMRTTGCNYPYTACFYGYRDYVFLYYYMRSIITTWGSLHVDKLEKHHAVDVSTAQRTAWGIMQPRFEGDISLFNFIVELKDFRSLARFLMNKPIRKLKNLFWRFLRSKKIDPTKPLAQAHLANEFAIKPLISDIVNIGCQMDALIADVQQDFADAGRVRNSRHYTEVFNYSETNAMSDYYQARYPHYMGGESEQLTFTATMEYSYEYNMRSTLDALSKYWGLAPNAEAIWNAIPFSFLVDYVYKIGDALAINSRDKRVSLELHQYCESRLSERTSGLHFKASRLFGPFLGAGRIIYPGPTGNICVHGARSTFYTRTVTVPNKGAVLPRLSKPTTKQGWNIAALTRAFF